PDSLALTFSRTPWQSLCSPPSMSRAKQRYLVRTMLYERCAWPNWEIAPRPRPDSWEFAPRAASAILRRSIDYRRTDANLLQGAPPGAAQELDTPVMRIMMKSKIHRATVTQADLDYVGSVTLDAALMEAADLLDGEQVAI